MIYFFVQKAARCFSVSCVEPIIRRNYVERDEGESKGKTIGDC